MAEKKKKRPAGPTSAGQQQRIGGRVVGKVGKTSTATNTIIINKRKEDAHAPWKKLYFKETGKRAEGIKQKAAYNTWLAAKRKARAAKAKPGAIATVAAKAKGGK